jgi:hypothetical protein
MPGERVRRRRIVLRRKGGALSAPLLCLTLVLIATALASASPAAAQTMGPHPCPMFTSCATVAGPWVSNAYGNGNEWVVACPTTGTRVAVGSDVVFKGAVQPAGIEIGGGRGPGSAGGLGPGGDGFWFELFVPLSFRGSINWQPAVGCAPWGASFSPLGRAAGFRRPFRRLVRNVPVRPGADMRLKLRCSRGERLVRSGSGVGFFTRRPPSDRVWRAIEHRHRRTGRVARTLVTAPASVGDNERVEVQTTVLCAPARAAPAQVPYQTPRPCAPFTSCTTVLGPWVTTPANGGDAWDVNCPSGLYAEGADAVFDDYAVRNVGVQTNSNLGPGFTHVLTFGAFPGQPQIKYLPGVGCLAKGATAGDAAYQRPAGLPRRMRVRKVRIRPGADVRVRLACRRGERLMHSGSGVGFFTRRPPSDRIVAALSHHHRRTGRITRTFATGPPGVGDDERVELHVIVQCERVR